MNIENETLKSLKENEDSFLNGLPRVNVITKETCEERTRLVYKMMRDILSGTFGPNGANALIYNYPHRSSTKDGYTVTKALSFDTTHQLVDQSIADSISDISFRLNHTVGDGTTSALIATAQIYESYLTHKEEFANMLIMPRDILKAFDDVVAAINPTLDGCATMVDVSDRHALAEFIHQVVYISSNGNYDVAKMISDLYYQIGHPSITCVKADGGVTRPVLIDGYRTKVLLGDPIYCNNDGGTLRIDGGVNVVIFNSKIDMDVYEKILIPLNQISAWTKRHLIVVGTAFDDLARNKIAQDLYEEFRKTGSINMILCAYSATRECERKLIYDFAMLCNTTVIDRPIKRLILDVCAKESSPISAVQTAFCIANGTAEEPALENLENGLHPVRLGYIGTAELGMKSSTFSGFVYNQTLYDTSVRDAEREYNEAREKYGHLGAFNVAVRDAQNRLNSLKLKTGIIEVSGDGALGQGALKDSVDDAIRAAESAYNHGTINGCNVDTIFALEKYLATFPENIQDYPNDTEYDAEKTRQYIRYVVASILLDGFIDVYRTILKNAYPTNPVILPPAAPVAPIPQRWSLFDSLIRVKNREHVVVDNVDTTVKNMNAYLRTVDVFSEVRDLHYTTLMCSPTTVDALNTITGNDEGAYAIRTAIEMAIEKAYDPANGLSLIDFIIAFSTLTRTVFDVSTRKFSYNVINSTQTDREILHATKDHISNLISGQFMVVTQKNT